MPAPLLETQGLVRRFGGFVAVDDVHLTIRRGEFHSLIGPNGAGKTTLLNLLSGDLTPTEGRIFYGGQEITGRSLWQRARLGISRAYQLTHLFPRLSAFENVRLAVQSLHGAGVIRDWWIPTRSLAAVQEKTMALLEEVGLAAKASLPALALSHGDQRKLELAMALALDPEVLLLDEPTAGMAVEEVPGILAVIGRVFSRGNLTIVMVEHRMDIVLKLSQRITVMHLGRLLAQGTPVEIVQDRRVQEAYLGGLSG
ncbi:MAG: ABC transporter ATP-binding protein [Bacillota bacterium]|nr:ABC transporter ATP-binding protein [Bacillota bacterium]